jgi:glycolate oxidase FAD binding subunit
VTARDGNADAAPTAAFPFTNVAPGRVERPADRAALAGWLAATTGTVVPVDGLRERTASAPLAAAEWTAVDVRGLDRLVDWQPDDLTVTVETGMSLAGLAARLAEGKQWLPIEAPGAGGATVGHVVAEAITGDRATRFGGPRRHLIGVTVADGAGRLTRAGGRLVKNVAGYDLMKLHAGARETLGLLVEMTFRLRPLPEAVLRLEGTSRDMAGAAAFARALALGGLEPDRCVVVHTAGHPGVRIELEFSGFAEDVREEGCGVAAIDAAGDWSRIELTGESVCDEAGAATASRGDRIDLEGFVRITPAAEVLERAIDWSAVHPGWGRRLEWHPLADRFRIVGDPATAAGSRSATDLDRLRAAIEPLGARVALRGTGSWLDPAAPPERGGEFLDGAPPATLDLVRRLKAALDPGRRFQPGRFFWGL